jgi:2-C-methyl-D-erythritol 2,4-cyclodiphosphate synthase
MNIRVGFGFDVHRLVEGESLVLGGVNIPYEKGTLAHSDGDVLIHAICDALLGTVSAGDIGVHFPDTDPTYKNIDSRNLLEKSYAVVKKKGYEIANIDTTICMQKPKLKPHIESMRKTLASLLKLDLSRVSVKATTTEKLGYVGREEGVSAYAIVLISK